MGAIVGRLARPGSERATWGWLRRRNGLGELLDFDFQTLSLMQMYRELMRHRQAIEAPYVHGVLTPGRDCRIQWLREEGYRYVVASRQGSRQGPRST